MPFQQVPDTTQVSLRFARGSALPGDWHGQTGWYVRNTVIARDIAYYNLLLDSAETVWNTYIAPLTPVNVRLLEVEARDLDVEFGTVVTRSVSHPGTATGEVSGSIMSPLLRFVGDPGAAPRRGRMYLPPTSETLMAPEGDRLTAAGLTVLTTMADALADAVDAAASDAMVIVSRITANAFRPVAVTNTLADIVPLVRLGSQIRRRSLPT